MGHAIAEVMHMAKKKTDGRTPATPAAPDPTVPNRARAEMRIGDPAPKGEYRDPRVKSKKTDP